jgi:hypothetical protein
MGAAPPPLFDIQIAEPDGHAKEPHLLEQIYVASIFGTHLQRGSA